MRSRAWPRVAKIRVVIRDLPNAIVFRLMKSERIMRSAMLAEVGRESEPRQPADRTHELDPSALSARRTRQASSLASSVDSASRLRN